MWLKNYIGHKREQVLGGKEGSTFSNTTSRKGCSSSEISFACFSLPGVAGCSGVCNALVHNSVEV